jgi:hypothetical protein
MLMVGALSIIEQHSPKQLFIGFLMCFVYLLIVLRSGPYKDAALDRLSFVSSLSLASTFLFCLMKGTDEHRAALAQVNYEEQPWDMFADGILGKTMIILNSVPFIWAIVTSLIRWFQRRKEFKIELQKHANHLARIKSSKHHNEIRDWSVSMPHTKMTYNGGGKLGGDT